MKVHCGTHLSAVPKHRSCQWTQHTKYEDDCICDLCAQAIQNSASVSLPDRATKLETDEVPLDAVTKQRFLDSREAGVLHTYVGLKGLDECCTKDTMQRISHDICSTLMLCRLIIQPHQHAKTADNMCERC